MINIKHTLSLNVQKFIRRIIIESRVKYKYKVIHNYIISDYEYLIKLKK